LALFPDNLFSQEPPGSSDNGAEAADFSLAPPNESNQAPENEGGKGGAADENEIVISAEDIEALKANKLEDVLNQVPGVSASSSSVAIHGSYKVRVFLDGTPLNDPTSSYGAVNFAHIPLSSIEKIVVIKDAGGLRHGQDATAGVVTIHSKNLARKKAGGFLRLFSGNREFFKSDVDLAFNHGKLGLGVRAAFERDRGFKINNDSEKKSGGFRALYAFAPERTLNFAIDRVHEEYGLSGLPDFPTPNSRGLSDYLSSSFSLAWGKIENNLYVNRGKVENRDRFRGLLSALTVTEIGDFLAWEGDSSFGKIALGTGYARVQADSSDFGRQSEYTIHAFADLSFKIPPLPFAFKAGARFNYNSGFENSLNPELGVVWRSDPFEISYKLSYGVNTPTFQQRYTRTSSMLPNPSLGVEKALNQNIAVQIQAKKNLSLSLGLFRNSLDGRISYVRPLNTGAGSYRNLGKTVFTGLDLGGDYSPVEALDLKFRYSYLVAKDKDLGRFLTAISRDRASIEAMIRPLDDFSLALKAEHTGRSFLDRENTRSLGSRTLYGLRAEYVLFQFALSLNVENMFDKKYHYIDGLLGPPRTYRASVKWSF
jgi:iron complex outermembrane receptor protein